MQEDIEIVPHDPRWVEIYGAECAALAQQTDGLFSHIEHIGSTAIPGLRAKPVIDIMAAIASLADVDFLVPALNGLGYAERPGNFSSRRYFRKEGAHRRPPFHLHIVPARAWADKNERLFRDWLMARPPLIEAYGSLKDRLAGHFVKDREGYTDAKGEFIRAVVRDARISLGLAPVTDWAE